LFKHHGKFFKQIVNILLKLATSSNTGTTLLGHNTAYYRSGHEYGSLGWTSVLSSAVYTDEYRRPAPIGPLAASSSELLCNLHWLPVRHRINFKIALVTFKILTFNLPSYLSSLVKFNIAPRPDEVCVDQANISFISPELAQSLEVVLSVQPHPNYGTHYSSHFALLLSSPHLNSSFNPSTFSSAFP
jgi:hypothetical protein